MKNMANADSPEIGRADIAAPPLARVRKRRTYGLQPREK